MVLRYLFLLVATAQALRMPFKFAVQQESPFKNPIELFSLNNVQTAIDSKIYIRANETVLKGHAQWVEVHWSGVQYPALDDNIGVVLAGSDLRTTAPIKFQMAAKCPTHLSLGAGSLKFRLLHMRHDVEFIFIRGGLSYPLVVSRSSPVRIDNPNLPTQGHLSLTGRPGEMMVQWNTRNKGRPQVRYSTSSSRVDTASPSTSVVVEAESTTYTQDDMCGAPANSSGWMDPGHLHYAVLTNLVPGQIYYYSYGDGNARENSWSEEYSFTAPPLPGPDANAVKILAVADMGQAEVDGSLEVSQMLPSLATTAGIIRDVVEENYQLLVHNGDVSYARGFSSQWDVFWDQLGPAVHRIPYMTAIGNHERDWPGTGDGFDRATDSGGECGVAYERQTKMPGFGVDKPWYSFDFGPVHFLQYSTEHDFGFGSEQRAFIEADLKRVDRRTTPWVIVGGHRPIYIDSLNYVPPDGDQPVAKALRDSLELLMYQYGVDVTWHGHHHSYQRTCPVFNEQCVTNNEDGSAGAPVHLVLGHAGAGLCMNVDLIRPDIFQVVRLQHGYVRVTANATHLEHEVVASATGSVMDTFVLTKPKGWQLSPARDVSRIDYDDDKRTFLNKMSSFFFMGGSRILYTLQ